jgi:hypothetical protein
LAFSGRVESRAVLLHEVCVGGKVEPGVVSSSDHVVSSLEENLDYILVDKTNNMGVKTFSYTSGDLLLE